LGLAYIFQESGEADKAVAVYEKALEKHPNLWIAANNLAALLSEGPDFEKDLDRALALAKRAQTLRSGEPSIQDTLGWIYYRKGDVSQALEYLEKALAREPENPIFNYHMGMALYKSGRIIEAREKLAKAVEGNEKFSGREEASEVLRRLEGEKGRR